MVTALVVSGGQGSRMGADRPKQFLELSGVPILVRTIRVFEALEMVDQIVVVLPEEHLDYLEKGGHAFVKPVHVVASGTERQSSVKRGLDKAMALDGEGFVMIHDAVRPLVSRRVLIEGLEHAKTHGAAACGVPPKDTVKRRSRQGFSLETLPRDALILVQTPQVFPLEAIWQAHDAAGREGRSFTDDTQVYEAYAGKVYLYEGSYANIKITTPEDLLLAELLLDQRDSLGPK